MFWRQWVLYEFPKTFAGKNLTIYTINGYYQLFANLLSRLINLYWFKLIVIQVHRNLRKALGYEVEAYVDAQHGSKVDKTNQK